MSKIDPLPKILDPHYPGCEIWRKVLAFFAHSMFVPLLYLLCTFCFPWCHVLNRQLWWQRLSHGMGIFLIPLNSWTSILKKTFFHLIWFLLYHVSYRWTNNISNIRRLLITFIPVQTMHHTLRSHTKSIITTCSI